MGNEPRDGKKPKKLRVDERLVAEGKAATLELARAYVMEGRVVAGDQRVEKPSLRLDIAVPLRVRGLLRFASRAGDKLAGALADLGLEGAMKDAVVLDVGASTGGFTDCCLAAGARCVIALDVGQNQLAWRLRHDPRVISLERTDIRAFEPAAHPALDWVVADVSFNSLARLAPALRQAAPRSGTRFLVLVKPQFELSRGEVPAGGVVVQDELRAKAREIVREAFAAVGLCQGRFVEARVPGRQGNREIFYYVVAP